MFIIMVDNKKAYGRLFETKEEAEIWQQRYEINGIIIQENRQGQSRDD